MSTYPIHARLVPSVDGESAMRHRTAVVSALGTNGKVSVVMGTATVEASILDWVSVSVGDIVQVAAWAGDLLVLGRTETTAIHDTATESATFTTTTPHTFTHTPVGIPRGVLVFIDHGAVSTDLITSVTYGGVAMVRVSTAADTAGEAGRVYAYFLGSGIPAGAQTVSVVHSGSADVKHAVAVSVLASGNTRVTGIGTLGADQANPQVAVGSSAVGQRYSLIYSGLDSVASLTPLAGMTAIADHDYGNFVSRVDLQTTPSSGWWTIGYTAASDDVAMIGLAVVPVKRGCGLTLIEPSSVAGTGVRLEGGVVTFDTASSVSVNGSFTPEFERYLVEIEFLSHVSTVATFMRLRAAGVDNSTASSYGTTHIQTTGAATAYLSSNSDKWTIDMAASGATIRSTVDLNITAPALARETIADAKFNDVFAVNVIYGGNGFLYHNQIAAYDGFTIYVASGSMAGTARVYGKNPG